MSIQAKPVHEYFKQLQYLRHKTKLATIQQEHPQPNTSNLLESVHKIRSQALTFHQIEHEQAINNSNEKLLQKLLSISKRRPTAYTQTVACPIMTTFRNPARKKREKMITEMNQQMAERMLTRQSEFGQGSMRKSIEQYDRIKKTLANNKRALSLSHAGPLPSIGLSKSRVGLKPKGGKRKEQGRGKSEELVYPVQDSIEEVGVGLKEPILIKYEETDEQNREYLPNTNSH